MKTKNNPFLQYIHTEHISIASFLVFHYKGTRAKAQTYTQMPMHFAHSQNNLWALLLMAYSKITVLQM